MTSREISRPASLELQHISKHLAGVNALSEVSVALRPGEPSDIVRRGTCDPADNPSYAGRIGHRRTAARY